MAISMRTFGRRTESPFPEFHPPGACLFGQNLILRGSPVRNCKNPPRGLTARERVSWAYLRPARGSAFSSEFRVFIRVWSVMVNAARDATAGVEADADARQSAPITGVPSKWL
jgi:hypothetical protein